jgi:hypothetical protein
MIADAPYATEELVLTPATGAAAGCLAALVMLALVGVLWPVGPTLGTLARAALPDAWIQPGVAGELLGLGVHVVVGTLLGLLYATSQRAAPPAAMIITGVVFGVMLWVGARVVSGLAFGGMRPLIHSWGWFLSCIVFGLCLAVAAVFRQRFRPGRTPIVLKD